MFPRCHEQRAERPRGLSCSSSAWGARSGHRGDGLQGLGEAQLPGAGQLQSPFGAGSVLEEALPQSGKAEGVQQNVRSALWLCDGELHFLCRRYGCEVINPTGSNERS